jgi:hypothetical protein
MWGLRLSVLPAIILVLSAPAQAQQAPSPDFNPLRWRAIDDEPWVRSALRDMRVRGAVECAAEPNGGFWFVIVQRGKKYTAHRLLSSPHGERLIPLGGEDTGKRHDKPGEAKYAIQRERYSDYYREKNRD